MSDRSAAGGPVPSLTVVVPTYRRPGVLSACLDAVVPQARQVQRDGLAQEVRVLVVDNDPGGSAEAEVTARTDGVGYVREPVPGIAAARARGLREVDSWLVAFLDDDEVPTTGWLAALLDTWWATGAVAVSGRVEPVFDGPTHPWLAAAELHRRPRYPTGTPLQEAAAGNLLIDAAWVQANGITFDVRLGLGGGEDSLFTRQLVAAGGRIVWCDESVAFERVPSARASRRWVARRFYSQGHATVIVAVLQHPARALVVQARSVVGGLARILAAVGWFARGVVVGSARDKGLALRLVSRGAGMVAGGIGSRHHEYIRIHDQTQTA